MKKPLYLGAGVVAVAALAALVALLLHAIERDRDRADRVHWTLSQVAYSLHGYHEDRGRLPPAAVYAPDGTPLLSWRVLLLPYVEEADLYRQFRLDEPWDGPHNFALLGRMPAVYGPPPGKAHAVPPHHTVLHGFVGPGAAFDGPVGLNLGRDFPDNPALTLLVVEGGPPVPWTKPQDIRFAADRPLPALSTVFPDGFRVAFASGSVRFIKKGVTEATLRAAITRNGGDTYEPDW